MIDANRPMEMNFEADYAGVDATTYAPTRISLSSTANVYLNS
jgi:hypothetical protein